MLAARARQLRKRPEDLAAIADRVLKSRQESVKDFIRRNAKKITDFDFKPGALVLVRNSAIELSHNRKSKPRFFGPMVVVRKTSRKSYVLAELDGATGKLHYAGFRVIPYYARSHASVPVTQITDDNNDEHDGTDDGGDGADDRPNHDEVA
jgi:hypothetical protein